MLDKYLYESKTNKNVYALFLPAASEEFIKYENCPVEFLYTKTVLEKYGMLAKKLPIEKINEYRKQDPLNRTDYQSEEGLWFYKLDDSKKAHFAESIKSLHPKEFVNFEPLFELIQLVLGGSIKQS